MKSVVVLSGGMDSLAALAWAQKIGDEVTCVNFQYGSKHNHKEAEAIRKIISYYNVPFKQVHLDFNSYLKSDLLTSGGEIPEGHYADKNMKKTVIPFRNGIMLAIAAGFAESIEADRLILGNHAGDHAIYPDCRKDFISAMSAAVTLGTYTGIEICSPFQKLTKGKIVKVGLDLKVPFRMSWSCYKGEDIACGRCGTCVERLEAFDYAETEDPIEYVDREFYKTVLKTESTP